MNLFQEHAVRDYAAAAAQIPLIDFGPCFAGEPGALEHTAAVVRHACENIGFFYAANHGVPDALINRAFAASRRFHALPLAEKLNLRLNENNIGYLRSTPRCRALPPCTRRPDRTKTKAFSSATIAAPIIPTSSPGRHYAAATSGRQASRNCATT